jgi:Tfp pilus assembly protein PilN
MSISTTTGIYGAKSQPAPLLLYIPKGMQGDGSIFLTGKQLSVSTCLKQLKSRRKDKTMQNYNASLAQYRLATKNKFGEVVQFGPRMAMATAERKRKAMVALTSYPLYIVNVNAI